MEIVKQKFIFAAEHPGFTKERIYGSVTLLATNLWLYSHIDDITVKTAFTTILTTALGLWLAGIFAEIIAEKLAENHTNWKNSFTHSDKKELLRNSFGILHSAFFPIILLALANFHIISLKQAIFTAILVVISQLVLFIFLAFFKKENNLLYSIILVAVQIAIFGIILFLKLWH